MPSPFFYFWCCRRRLPPKSAMEDGNLETPKSILYETLTPFTLSPTHHVTEPYTVFRNQISLSALQCPSPETAAPDFFSLDVGSDSASERESLSAAATEPKTPALVSEPKLESNWFRGNCKFRSPLLQLHKGRFSLLSGFVSFSVIYLPLLVLP